MSQVGWLSVLAVLVGCAAEPEASAMRPFACGLVACASGVDFVVHLPTTLTPRAVTACRSGICAHAAFDAEPKYDTIHGAEGDDDGPLAVARCPSVELRASFDRGIVDVWMSFSDRVGSRCRQGHPADGERFELRVEFAEGPPLVFERYVLFGEPFYPNGAACDAPEGYFCKQAVFEIWPGSQSGLVCSGLARESGVLLRAKAGWRATDLEGATVKTCRNDLCAAEWLAQFPCASGATWVNVAPYPTLAWICEEGRVDAFSAAVPGDPATLRDGDRYQLTVTKSGKTLFSGEKRVTYDRSWPNGALCDAYPQLVATVDL